MTTALEAPVASLKRGELPDVFAADITPRDVVEGEACVADRCPVAIAIKRSLKVDYGVRNIVSVTVSVSDVSVVVGNWRQPAVGYFHDSSRWISDFDHNRPVKPCTVMLHRIPAREAGR